MRTTSILVGLGLVFISISSLGAEPAPKAQDVQMEKVEGFGGFFFRSNDPKALSAWYEQHLGITISPKSKDDTPWKQTAGITIFAPFPNTTKYFGNPEKTWMLNFRVKNLDAMVAQLKAAGIDVVPDPHNDATNKFARLVDPEGNPIELWQPAD